MEHKYADITHKIIACSFEVHNALKSGFPELIYHRALAIEFAAQSLSFISEYEMPIFFKGNKIGVRRVDFLVEQIIPVEIKAIAQLEDAHLAQAINYLEAYNLEIGLLINFGSKSVEYRRLYNAKYKQS
jgi:GxxExxY protein